MMKHLIRLLWIVPAGFSLVVLLGFSWFAAQSFQDNPKPPPSDGIVVLTGGEERVRAGLQLLGSGVATHLLISGVGRDAEFPRLARLAGVDPGLSGRVTLGYLAHTTHGNALEIADWVALQHAHSLIVVTAGYHMPRAMAELRMALPGIVLIPFAVQPKEMHVLSDLRLWRLLAREYMKFVAVELGLGDRADRLAMGAVRERRG